MIRLFSIITLLLFSIPAFAVTEIKFALLAPEGSAWHDVVSQWSADLKKQTNGRVSFRIYAGGVLGDERDVLRKMRIGQVHAAGFTGFGLGLVNSEVRVLELPMLVNNYNEADILANAVWPKLMPVFQKKGFTLLAKAETGFIYILSNSPIGSRKQMNGKKMWAWEGDPLVESMYKVYNIVPIPLPLTDVLTSLQTRLIDAVYAPPLGAIALQWFTETKYMSDLKLANSTGGILISNRILKKLSPTDQKILTDTGRIYEKKLIARTRKDNDTSYQALIEAGVEIVHIPENEAKTIETNAHNVWTNLIGTLYSQDLLTTATQAITDYRKSN